MGQNQSNQVSQICLMKIYDIRCFVLMGMKPEFCFVKLQTVFKKKIMKEEEKNTLSKTHLIQFSVTSLLGLYYVFPT